MARGISGGFRVKDRTLQHDPSSLPFHPTIVYWFKVVEHSFTVRNILKVGFECA